MRTPPSLCLLAFITAICSQANGQLPTADTLASARDTGPEQDRQGSTNVAMDSWIYPALERLADLGMIPSQAAAVRPWSRQECRRQMLEAKLNVRFVDPRSAADREAEQLLPALESELITATESGAPVLDSLYLRYRSILGPALTDGFHFGQSWWNDFGRPLGRGGSVIAGYSLRATHGRFFFYARHELQQASAQPGFNVMQRALVNQLDAIPVGPPVDTASSAPASPVASFIRQRPVELYAGVAFAGYSASFGKQVIFWGPTTMGPLSFSVNAEPTYNFRLASARPHRLPLAPALGTYTVSLVFGKLSGHHFPARPYFNGQKLDLTLGPNLELSFTRWSILWGQGHPITAGSLLRNFVSTASTGSSFAYADRSDPGDRKSGFDFRLHVPGTGKRITLYADSYADDEPSPLDAPRRVIWSPGIYLSRLPGIPHADLRFEMASSEELSQDEGGLRAFINTQYRDANTNKGFLLGNAVGRDARAFEARSTYWWSADSTVGLGFRQNKGGTQFLPGGSTITDIFLRAGRTFHSEWSFQVFAQAERFLIPAYTPGAHHNLGASLQLTWNPHLRLAP